MPEKKIKSAFEKTLHLAWGGSRHSYGDEVLIDAPPGGNYFDGPALRDALLEAFPLEKDERPAGWEKELHRKVFATPLAPSVFKAEKPQAVPGSVFQSRGTSWRFTVLPDGRYYDHASKRTYTYSDFASDPLYDLVFDPRDAVALPSPLGIRVGDKVRRVTSEGDTDGDHSVTREVTIEFTVNHVSTYGTISSKYGLPYDPEGFKVVSREVPNRLPAGTLTRRKKSDPLQRDELFLTTEKGWIDLKDGFVSEPGDMSGNVRSGHHEVIYLPES